MGLFSSKYKTYVATSVTRVIEDQALPNAIRTGVLRSLIERDDQMIEGAMDELSMCIGIKANLMYNYGRDHYMHGLPTGVLETPTSGQALVEQVIEESFGPVTIDYYRYGMLNTLHVGWTKLFQLHNYNSLTNTLTYNNKTVYLQDMVVVVKEATLAELENGALDHWGTAPTAGATPVRVAFPDLAKHTPWEASPTAPNDYVRVTYTSQLPSGLMETGTFNIDIAGFDESASFHQVKFKKADGSDGYWLYKANGGIYPAIDKLHTPAWQTGGTYFPWVYFRYAKQSLSEDMTLPESKQMHKLTKYISMDFNDVADAINENPEIDQVENAMLMMGVPAVTTDQQELRYLFDYTDGLYQVTGGTLGAPSKKVSGISGQLAVAIDSSVLDNQFLIQDKKFKMAIGFRKIYKTRVSGVLGKIGHMAMESGKKVVVVTGADNKEQHSFVSFHIYRRQLSDSTYEQIEVENFKVKYYVYGDYSVAANEEDDNVLIPLDKSITENYSVPDREILYARSLHYVFNSRVVQEIKWYQQSWFKALMIVVAVIITIITLGKTWKLIVAAMAIGATAYAIAMIVVMQLLRQLVVAYAIKLFVKTFGAKVAFLVALVAVIYGGFQAIEAGSVEGAPWAQELLALGNGLTKAIQDEFMKDFNALQREQEEFTDYIKSKEEKLKEAENELGYNNYLAPTVIFGESPNEFYDRTVHSGNIGVMSLDAITSYVDVQLTLPTLNQTMEEKYGY